MEFFNQILRDAHGQASTIRVLSFIVVLTIMFTWAIVCISNSKIEPIGYDNAIIVTAVMGAKVTQRKQE